MTTIPYCGIWDNPHEPPRPGTRPDWDRPHDPHEDNVAIIWTKGGNFITVNQIIVRNRGDETLHNLVDVYLYAKALNTWGSADTIASLTMDDQSPMEYPPDGIIPERLHQWEIVWENQTVPHYSASDADRALKLLPEGQAIQWHVPKGYSSVCLVVAIQCPVLKMYPQYPPSQDPCIAIRRTAIPLDNRR